MANLATMNNKSIRIQSRNVDLHVLIIGARPPQADPLLRELRRANYDVTPHYADSLDSLNRGLVEEHLALVILDDAYSAIPGDEVLHALKVSGQDIPCIVVAQELDVETAVGLMRQGARDCISRHDLHRLPEAVDRELREAEARRNVVPKRHNDRTTLEIPGTGQGAAQAQPALQREHTKHARVGNAQYSVEKPGELPEQSRALQASESSTVKPATPTAATQSMTPSISQVGQCSHEATAALASIVQAFSTHNDPAALVHALSVHLKSLLPFDTVGLSLLPASGVRHTKHARGAELSQGYAPPKSEDPYNEQPDSEQLQSLSRTMYLGRSRTTMGASTTLSRNGLSTRSK
jgi:DNA-binding NarL/FixJ family response regulator